MLDIVKDMRQKSNRHRKPLWPMLLSFANCVNSFKLYKPLRQPRHLRGHPLSQRQLLHRRPPRRQLHLHRMQGNLRTLPPRILCWID